MKITEAVKLLRHYQGWRLGDDIEMLEPKQVTEVIDTILHLFEEKYTKKEFLDAAEAGEVSMIDAKHIVSLLDELKQKNND
jgi:hypothetical protein